MKVFLGINIDFSGYLFSSRKGGWDVGKMPSCSHGWASSSVDSQHACAWIHKQHLGFNFAFFHSKASEYRVVGRRSLGLFSSI